MQGDYTRTRAGRVWYSGIDFDTWVGTSGKRMGTSGTRVGTSGNRMGTTGTDRLGTPQVSLLTRL